MELCAEREGAAAAEKVKEKRNKYKHTLRPEQYPRSRVGESLAGEPWLVSAWLVTRRP